jgi:hypothetical protein
MAILFIALSVVEAFSSPLRSEARRKNVIAVLDGLAHPGGDGTRCRTSPCGRNIDVSRAAVRRQPNAHRLQASWPREGDRRQPRRTVQVREMIGKRRQRSIPVMTLGDDDTQSLEFDAFRRCVSEGVFEQVRSGIVSMAFVAVADYTDVLGRRHRTRNEGVYRAKERVFEITSLEAS